MQKMRYNRITVCAIILAACLFYAISSGIRSNYGLIQNPISANSGVTYASISFILAVAQLSFGIMQPVFGVLALKKSNGFVLSCGAILATIGLIGIPFCHLEWMLMLFLGLMMPIGLAAFSFGIIMGSITPILGERRAAAVSGFVSASSGLGSIILAPLLRGMLDNIGLWGAILSLGIPTLCLIPVAFWFSRFGNIPSEETEDPDTVSFKEMVIDALKNRSYLFLMIAFFTCGFHMAIIETHLYSQFISYGFSDEIVAYSFSLYGIMAMIGSVVSGVLCSRFSMKRVLGCFYGSRAIWIIGFMFLPKTLLTIYAYAAVLGFTGNATVPPTSGLINKLYGPVRLGTLFGFVFVAHQVGSFFSAWFGGLCVTATGSYTLIWIASAMLSILAATASFLVKET